MNKEQVLRDLEYLGGGMDAMAKMCNSKANAPLYELMTEWREIVYNIVYEVVRGHDNAKQSTRVS